MGDVTLEHVSKHCDDVMAVDDINPDINDGEFIRLVGPSGCGKSAAMEMIAGLTIPSEGKIFIGDHEVTNLPSKDYGVAVVFQNIALLSRMDVYDNVSFGLRLRDYDKEEIERYVKCTAETVQLQGMLGRMPDEMFSGQRQRVAIARAVIRNPDVFLMDEPLTNLDVRLWVHIRTELQRLHKELNTTIIYVAHDQTEMMTISDRIVVIGSEQLQQIDPPLVCYNGPANLFIAGFIGSSSMNFLNGEVAADDFSSTNIDVEFDLADLGVEPGTGVTMSIRPEDVYLVNEESLVSNPSHRIDAMTDVFEPMGDEIFVYLKLSGSAEAGLEDANGAANGQLLMSAALNTDIAKDEDMTVVPDYSRVRLLGTATDEAISRGVETSVQTSGTPGTEAESDD